MTRFETTYSRMIEAMGVKGLRIPVTGVKFYYQGDTISSEIKEYETEEVSVTSCQANKMSGLGDAVLLTRRNIGCIAAAITFGLVDQNQEEYLSGSRIYTDIMKDQSGHESTFTPPGPADFTDGSVYACAEANLPDFCLFGPEDSGRFKTREIAKKAIKDMTALQPASTTGVFFFPPEFDEADIEPDVVTMNVRPVELTRIAQAWQFLTGERVESSMGPVRVVNSDLIVRPLVTGKINFSSYCVGARLIAQYEPDRLGIGIPFKIFKEIADGMEESKTGYPFPMYPGATAVTEADN